MTILRWFRSVLVRARLALMVFRKGLPKVDRETDKVVAELLSGQRKPGFPCPRCNQMIAITVSDLLASGNVCCSRCELVLKMEWQQDPLARSALENLQAAALKVEQSKKFSG